MCIFKKTFLVLTLAFTLLVGISTTVLAEDTTKQARVISTTPLNMRDSGSTSGKAVGEIPVGAVIEVLKSDKGSWYLVKYGETEGWVNPKYLTVLQNTISNGSSVAEDDNSQQARVISTTPLNIRDSGSTSGKVLGAVPVGKIVDVLENTSGGWSLIKYGEIEGWVNPKYLITVPSTASRGDGVTGEDIVDIAMTHLGKPYVYGATGPNSFDCSGLTQYVYKQAGISLVRTSSQQSNQGTTVAKSNLQAGDLVFFNSGGSTAVSHVGIYIGDGKMIHSPRTGDVVKVASLMKNFVRGKRIL